MTAMTLATRLDASASVILDSSGYGYVRLAPTGEKWEITRSRMECNTSVNEALGKMYVNVISNNKVVDGTYSASTGDTSDTVVYLEDGQAIFYEWTGGDAGATATVTLSGWRSTPDGGFRAVH